MYYSILWNRYDFPVRRRVSGPNLSRPKGFHWTSGKAIPKGTITKPLVVQLEPFEDWNEDGQELPALFDILEPPIVSRKLCDDLFGLGVDNVDAYPVHLVDPDNDAVIDSHVALNIVGLLFAADMRKSTYTINPGGAYIDTTFSKLIIDSNKVKRAMMFRLAENTSTFFVNETIRTALIKKGYKGLEFVEAENTAFL